MREKFTIVLPEGTKEVQTEQEPHRTQQVHIKTAEVDEKIIPIVQWFNSFSNVNTLFCCQGDEDNRGYVSFLCRCPKTLHYILSVMNTSVHMVRFSVSLTSDETTIIYNMTFPTDRIKYMNGWIAKAPTF